MVQETGERSNLIEFISNLHTLPFEQRKEFLRLFAQLLAAEAASASPLVALIAKHKDAYMKYVFEKYS